MARAMLVIVKSVSTSSPHIESYTGKFHDNLHIYAKIQREKVRLVDKNRIHKILEIKYIYIQPINQ